MVRPMSWATLTATLGEYEFRSAYDERLISALKAGIPSTGRKWDSARKLWLIDPAYVGKLLRIVDIHLGVTMSVPNVSLPPAEETTAFELYYCGQCKDRDGESMATGLLSDGSWGLLFPEKVLRDFFADDAPPQAAQTLYAVLAVQSDATEDAIKSAFRRMAKLTHPDVNKEPTAHEDFKRVNHAYAVLSDPVARRKYTIGLSIEADARNAIAMERRHDMYRPYRPPIRCGLVLCTGTWRVGRFLVSELHSWVDIVDNFGRTMVTSWPKDSDKLEVRWV